MVAEEAHTQVLTLQEQVAVVVALEAQEQEGPQAGPPQEVLEEVEHPLQSLVLL
jgi:hypothetical protein